MTINRALVDLTPFLMGDPVVRPPVRQPTEREKVEARRREQTPRTPQGPAIPPNSYRWRPTRAHVLERRRAWLAEGIEAARAFRDRMRAQFSSEAEA